ncbi:MAG: tRNA (guanosine(37)-N1)-methyltransferase TrmD [Candidatus Omnitrophica bacterium]|nr:tRNA (guanosine(37)-N1)-methyltransferase TrmD [Candidatus Omnitrophota bacterium]
MKKPHLAIDVITLFPKLLEEPLNESMAKQAKKRGAIGIKIHNLRDFALDKRRTCDDKPFGGGAGMVMMVQPIFDCLKKIGSGWKIMVSPRGKIFSQAIAARLAKKRRLIFICGHYEGIDERVHERLVDEEISLGDFLMTGGEFPALCFIDAIIRLVPGVLGNQESLHSESFGGANLDFPQYTRPRNFRGWKVPEALFSGNHRQVESWRKRQAEEITKKFRPDLISK